jgi:hypothetical protein
VTNADEIKIRALCSGLFGVGMFFTFVDAKATVGAALVFGVGCMLLVFTVSVALHFVAAARERRAVRKRRGDVQAVAERVVYWDQGGNSYARSDGASDWMTRDSS